MHRARQIPGGVFALLYSAGLAVCAPGCGFAQARAPQGYRDVTLAAGLQFQYQNDARGEHRFIETTGGGCAFLDFDNDGRLDILAVQGGAVPGTTTARRPPHALYRSNGDGTFTDMAARAGLATETGYAQGVAAADYDNDGWTDVLITSYGGVHLFRNVGGRFVEVTRPAGLVQPGEPHWATSAAWADYDRDGNLDLFVCHYASWFPDIEQPCFDSKGRPIYCTPTVYAGDTSRLYRNTGKGRFENATRAAGLHELEGKALGAAWLDCEGDGWPDLFVANDMAANWLFRNQRNGRFRQCASEAGVALGPGGLPLSGMGVAVGDFNEDAREDLFVVNFSRQPRSLWLNRGEGLFEWGSRAAGVGGDTQPFLAFGVEALDFDLDGDLDLVVGNGHLNQVVDRTGTDVTYRQRQQLLRNDGSGRFVEDRLAAGHLNTPRITRGLAVGDCDNDGQPECLASGPEDPLTLFRKEPAPGMHWVGFRLEGIRSNRDAVGARVTVRAGGRARSRTLRSGSSYCSRSDLRALFGLGGASPRIEAVEVRWPSGAIQRFGTVEANRYYLIREGGACQPDPRLEPTGRAGRASNTGPRA